MKRRASVGQYALLCLVSACALADQPAGLTVVERGGVSASAYYRSLKLQGTNLHGPRPTTPPRSLPPFTEESALPVKSARLTPGAVEKRAIRAPGLTPLFIVGDDTRSRAWLRARYEQLRALGASGLVVNVASLDALKSLRRLVPGLLLSPSAGDDFAQRLNLAHYPVLITATAIEQ